MTAAIVQFLASAVVIVFAGAALTQFGDVISHRTKIGGLLVGSILIAGATSLPELAINVNSVRIDSADLALGDLLGSSLINLLILAGLDLTRYSRKQMLSKAAAGHALSASTSIALTAIVAIFIFLGPKLGEATFLRLGPGSFVLIAGYVIGIRIIYFGQQENKKTKKESDTKDESSILPWIRKLSVTGAFLGYAAAAAIILIAAPFLSNAANDLAEQTALGGTFFGSTFVALSTSLPEVVTTFAAVQIKAFDLALGNIFGSNCFNMMIVVAVDFVDAGSLLAGVQSTHVYTALCAIVVTSVVILGQLFRVERSKHFFEPDAWLAVGLILASFTGLYFVRE